MKLLPELVPSTAWGANLRSELPRATWDSLRNETYRKAGYKCEICGGKGRKHPVECHEIWDYNEQEGIQKLLGLIGLCPACHEVKHIGLAEMNGRMDAAKRHLCKINGISASEAGSVIARAYKDWERRSSVKWKRDISALDCIMVAGAGLKEKFHRKMRRKT